MRRLLLCSFVCVAVGLVAACGGETGGDDSDSPVIVDEVCGDGDIQEGEVCDGDNLGGETCQSLGHGAGELACRSNCTDFDRSNCGAPASCGDGTIDDGEECDGSALGGETCGDLGFGGGELACSDNCLEYDTSGCEAPETCGNGEIDDGEVCDGDNLDGATCESLDEGSGELSCADDCMQYDSSGCESQCQPQCGDRECGEDPNCGESCGECGEFEACTEAGACERTCDLDPIEDDTTVDIDVQTASVSVEVGYEGGTMPDNSTGSEPRAWIEFRNPDNGESVTWSLGTDGTAEADGELFAGTYDVRLVPNDLDAQDVLPSHETILATGVDIEPDASLDYDVSTVTVDGSVTLDGAEMPDNGYSSSDARGRIEFVGPTGSVGASLGATGPAEFETELFADTYEVRLAPTSSHRQDVLPAYSQTLAESADLTSSRTLTYDVSPVTVDGTVTLDGSTMPDNAESSSQARGHIEFVDTSSGETTRASIGNNRDGDYSLEVYPGTYDVRLAPNGPSDQDVLPHVDAALAEGVSISSSDTRDFDLSTGVLQGELTVDGSTMPDNSDSAGRGTLLFVNRDTGDSTGVSLGADGRASFEVQVPTGSYDLVLEPNGGDDQDVLPPIDAGVATDVSVTSGSQQTDFDVEIADVQGTLTVDGSQMPAGSGGEERGAVQVRSRKTGESLYMSVGAEGEASFEGRLYAEAYDVLFVPDETGIPESMPSATTLLEGGVEAGTTSGLDYDLGVATVSGEVTVDGGPMPDNSAGSNDRAALVFADPLTGEQTSAVFGPEGAATYSLEVYTGAYDVTLSPAPSDAQDALPAIAREVQAGCLTPPSCSKSDEDLSGRWSFVAEDSVWGTWTMTLDQRDGTIGGQFTNSYGQSGALEGSRSGDTLSFTLTAGSCYVDWRADVVNGCLMTGSLQSRGCPNTNPTSGWVATRID